MLRLCQVLICIHFDRTDLKDNRGGRRLLRPPKPTPKPSTTTLPTNGRVVSWACASAPRWPRPSWWLPTPVSVLVLPPLPTPWPLSSGSDSTLGLVAVVGRSVWDPAPRARARARLTWLLPTGPNGGVIKVGVENNLFKCFEMNYFFCIWCAHWLIFPYTCPSWCVLPQCWRPQQKKGCSPLMINWCEILSEIVEGPPYDWKIYGHRSSTSIISPLSCSFWYSSPKIIF